MNGSEHILSFCESPGCCRQQFIHRPLLLRKNKPGPQPAGVDAERTLYGFTRLAAHSFGRRRRASALAVTKIPADEQQSEEIPADEQQSEELLPQTILMESPARHPGDREEHQTDRTEPAQSACQKTQPKLFQEHCDNQQGQLLNSHS
jgi:hypothetical protein